MLLLTLADILAAKETCIVTEIVQIDGNIEGVHPHREGVIVDIQGLDLRNIAIAAIIKFFHVEFSG